MSGAKVDFLPCPFCNGAAEFYVRFDSQAIGWSDGLGSPGTHTTRFEGVRCTKCRARMDTDSKRESVVAAWNLRALAAEVERLEREKEALRVDAERYRWLRNESSLAPPTDGYMTWPVHGHDHTDAIPCYGEDLDAAIDAAIAARGRG